MSWLATTLAMYRRVFTRAAVLTLGNWMVLGTFFVYGAVMAGTAFLAARLGLVGGILLTLVQAACIGSMLYLVEMMVRTQRVSLDDFRRSVGAYLWDVVGVLFVFFVFSGFVAPALLTTPLGPPLVLGLSIALLVFFNAVPELIYLGHVSLLELLRQSYVFIGENWIEWFPANFAMGLLLVLVSALPLPGVLVWPQLAAVALLLYFILVTRGLLFLELHATSRRGRAFRHAAGE